MRFFYPLVASVALAFPAHAYMASNGLVIEPIGPTEFTVPYRGESGAAAFWCAAGEYVVGGLDLLPTTRIYRTSKPPRRAGEGISFSLRPEAAENPGVVILGSNDKGMSAAMAQLFCDTGFLPF